MLLDTNHNLSASAACLYTKHIIIIIIIITVTAAEAQSTST